MTANPMDIRMMFGVTEDDGWWWCRVCGAMVAERKTHYDWHEQLEAALTPTTNPDTRSN